MPGAQSTPWSWHLHAHTHLKRRTSHHAQLILSFFFWGKETTCASLQQRRAHLQAQAVMSCLVLQHLHLVPHLLVSTQDM